MLIRAYVSIYEFISKPNYLEQDEFIALVTPGKRIMECNDVMEVQINLDHYSMEPCYKDPKAMWKTLDEDSNDRHKFRFRRRPGAPPLMRNISLQL